MTDKKDIQLEVYDLTDFPRPSYGWVEDFLDEGFDIGIVSVDLIAAKTDTKIGDPSLDVIMTDEFPELKDKFEICQGIGEDLTEEFKGFFGYKGNMDIDGVVTELKRLEFETIIKPTY